MKMLTHSPQDATARDRLAMTVLEYQLGGFEGVKFIWNHPHAVTANQPHTAGSKFL